MSTSTELAQQFRARTGRNPSNQELIGELNKRSLPSASPPQVSPSPFQQTNQPAQPYDSNQVFQQTVQAMLKAAQGAGDEDLQGKRNAIINARFNAVQAPTPENLRSLAPSAQAGLRNLDAQGLEGQLRGVDAALKSRESKRDRELKAAQILFNVLTQQQDQELKTKEFERKGKEPITLSKEQSLYERQSDGTYKRLIGAGAAGGGTGLAPFVPKPQVQQKTFEQFLQDEQNKAGMSFAPARVNLLREQFAQQKAPATKLQADISEYSYPVQQVIRGEVSAASVLSGGSVGERRRYEQELRDADAKGLLKQNLSEPQRKFIDSLDTSVSKNASYARTVSMQGFANNVSAALSNTTGAGDIAAINQFQKVIDEGAVTRDQDVRLLVGQAQSIVNRAKSKIKQLEKGEVLSPDLRQAMIQTVELLYEAQVKSLKNDPFILQKIKAVERQGIPIEETILGELGSFEHSAGGASQGSAADILSKYGIK